MASHTLTTTTTLNNQHDDNRPSQVPTCCDTFCGKTVEEKIGGTMCLVFGFCFCMFVVVGIPILIDGGKRTPEFNIFLISFSHFKLNHDLSFSANWTLGFLIKNPGKRSRISYEQLKVSVCYRNVSLSSTSLSPFYQDEKEKNLVHASLGTSGVRVDREFARDYTFGLKMGAVSFGVNINGTLRINGDKYEGSRQNLTVRCEDLTVGISPSVAKEGSLVGGPKECSVRLKRES